MWAPDYIEVEDLAEYVRIDEDDLDEYETALTLAISSASRDIDSFTHRQFGNTASDESGESYGDEDFVERFYPVRYHYERGVWFAHIDDCLEVSQVLLDGNEIAAENYELEPKNNPGKGLPRTRIVLPRRGTEVAVTAVYGWASVPNAIKQATLLQASRLFARRTSPFGIAGSPDVGSELRLLARIDPDVQVSLGPYVRSGVPG